MLRIVIISLILCIYGAESKKPSKIVNGAIAQLGEFGHQASLRVYDQHICGGSIISHTHILTAAHCCVDNDQTMSVYQDMTVLTGTNDKSGQQSGQLHKVINIVCHEHYDPKNNWINDIAILTLAKSITFNRFQHSIKLPSRNLPPNTRVMASGWGALTFATPSSAPLILQKLDMRIVSNTECSNALSNNIYPGQICVLKGWGTGVCVGDSGGPLTYNNEVHGIASWVVPCAEGYPDVFTRVYYYLSWIQQHTRQY
ncbi:GSCOCT00007157001.2-RA-CDS [Cotesia congregata]|uniref:Trypsin-like n=1 Tax=Cotesia congregata TaxID=51543 RepID=A0A8J2HIX6_COTCN|nr:GSCOCT00007157001.2-RA-CDS [Cotesia congregata]CAG5092841.1 Trypsin-like [Cotesia congregata]